jgi:hypothetical protein
MESLSEEDKVRIFASLMSSSNIRIIYSDNKLTIFLNEMDLEKIKTYIKTKNSTKSWFDALNTPDSTPVGVEIGNDSFIIS